jgi:hypothetical protein
MNKFFKSIWFPIVLFIVLELVLFLAGWLVTRTDCPMCEMCPPEPAYCPPCECKTLHYSLPFVVFGAIPSIIISIVTYFLIKKYSK